MILAKMRIYNFYKKLKVFIFLNIIIIQLVIIVLFDMVYKLSDWISIEKINWWFLSENPHLNVLMRPLYLLLNFMLLLRL